MQQATTQIQEKKSNGAMIAMSQRQQAAPKRHGIEEASPRQKAYIAALATSAGVRVDVTRIGNREMASKVIDGLLRMAQPGANGSASDVRDRKVAFGLATKLVYRRYIALYGNIRDAESFWREVEGLYLEYQRRQERAIALHRSLHEAKVLQ